MKITLSDILGITVPILIAIGLIVIAVFLIRSVKNDNEKLYFMNPVDAFIYEYDKSYINSHKVGWAIILIIIGAMILIYHGSMILAYLMITH